jgi:hypothetical protein
VDRSAPWKTARRNEKLILQTLPFQQVGVCYKLSVGVGISYDIPKECFMDVEFNVRINNSILLKEETEIS